MNNREIEFVKSKSSGSTLTKVARETSLLQFKNICHKVLNLQVKSFKDLKKTHIQTVVNYLSAEGRSLRTLQNLMAHLRTALRACRQDGLADSAELSNSELGISGASRKGTHEALDAAKFEMVRARLFVVRPGAAACLDLQRSIGLRMAEAILANQSLVGWQSQIAKFGTVTVTHGTKGGKTRLVALQNSDVRQNASRAIDHAIEVAKAGEGRLIPSQTFLGAKRMYTRDLAASGMSGNEASHSARYAWAIQQYRAYKTEGCDDKEAKARLSMDLGHGDGRTDIIKNVYLLSLKGQI